MKLFEIIKDKALLFIGRFRNTSFKFTASDKTVSEAEHDRVLVDQLRDELLWHKEQLQQQNAVQEMNTARLREVKTNLKKIAAILLKAGHPYEEIYDLVASELDPGGWGRLSVARRLIPTDIYSFFYAEDALGKFENMKGSELLYWLELTKYGILDPIQKGNYELVGGHELRTDDKDYMDYRKRLHRLTLNDILIAEKDAVASATKPEGTNRS